VILVARNAGIKDANIATNENTTTTPASVGGSYGHAANSEALRLKSGRGARQYGYIIYRWREKDIDGKPVRRKLQVGSLEEYGTESRAQGAADALRLTINNQSKRRALRDTTFNTLWEHYSREELPLKELSTQDAYVLYAKNWILPRWADLGLEDVKTVEVERWLRATEVADGTKAKIKSVMSAVFSHAVLGNFVATIRFRQEYQSEAVGREGQARACGSVASVRNRRWFCHPTR
jgi:hypothetical protein